MNYKISCQSCGQSIEFPQELLETTVQCPTCNNPLLLTLTNSTIILPKPVSVESTNSEETFNDSKKKNKEQITEKVIVYSFVGLLLIGIVILIVFTYGPGSGTRLSLIEITGTILGIILGFIIYFFPSYVAHSNRKKNYNAIFLLNLLTGWTFIGWVISLVWASTKD